MAFRPYASGLLDARISANWMLGDPILLPEVMLRNQLKQRGIRVIGKAGAALVSLKPAKLFPIQNPKDKQRLSRLPASLSSDWPCRWIKIELNPRKLNSYMYLCSISLSLRRTNRGPPEVGKGKKIRLVSSLHACKPVMMQGQA